MTHNTARTADEYIASLSPDRGETVATVYDTVRRHMPPGYRESMGYGMITWTVPLERYPDTYNGQPLCYAGLASQKNHCSLYLMGCYGSPAQAERLKNAFHAAGKKLDMGKSCVRFRSVKDLPLEAIGELIGSVPVDEYLRMYEASRAQSTRPARGSSTTRSTASPRSRKTGVPSATRSASSKKPAKPKVRGGR